MLIAYTIYDVPPMFRFFVQILGRMFYDILGYGTINDVKTALNLGADWDNINDVVSAYSSVVKPLGLMFLAIGLVCFILEKATNGEGTSTDFIFKAMIKFVIGLFLINNCGLIIDWIMDFGNGLSQMITKAFMEKAESGNMTQEDINNAIADYFIRKCGVLKAFKFSINPMVLIPQIWNYLCVFCSWLHRTVGTINWFFIPWLLSKALFVATIVVSVSRLMEIGVRSLFAPIAIGTSAFDGNKMAGKTYFKQLASLCIQGAVILGITGFIGIASGVTEFPVETLGQLTNAFNVAMALPILFSLLFRIAAVILITKSREISDSIVGV